MIDTGTARTEIQAFLQDYLADSDASGYVVGVSGGLDSAVTLKLAVNAVGAGSVRAAILPGGPSSDEHATDARDLCSRLDVTADEIPVDGIVDQFTAAVPFTPDQLTTGNTQVRVRAVLLYMIANHHDLLVLGTSNRSELLVGYFTKWGDQAADVRAIADLYKTEVRQLAEELGLPDRFVEKEPTAGMWEGQTDEDELGASYETIDQVLQRYVDGGTGVEELVEETGIERQTAEHVIGLHEDSAHKRGPVPHPELRQS